MAAGGSGSVAAGLRRLHDVAAGNVSDCLQGGMMADGGFHDHLSGLSGLRHGCTMDVLCMYYGYTMDDMLWIYYGYTRSGVRLERRKVDRFERRKVDRLER